MTNTRVWVVKKIYSESTEVQGVYTTLALAKDAVNGLMNQDFRYFGMVASGVQPTQLFVNWITNTTAVVGDELDLKNMVSYQIIEKEVDA